MCGQWLLLAGSSPSLPDGSNPSAAIVQSASDVQCSRLLKTTVGFIDTRIYDDMRHRLDAASDARWAELRSTRV
ncbi:hypothetical protein [Pseudomonas aeruginosa]|uniref:hypothetical protein n=1 Tax=Pseudomonas aeruginosa TaxID=287 RepID=UPI0021E1D499|nr:hypothetical protein [Pseudomonas aeruginosa]